MLLMHYDLLPISDTMRAEDLVFHLEGKHCAQILGADKVPIGECYEFLSSSHLNIHLREALRRMEGTNG